MGFLQRAIKKTDVTWYTHPWANLEPVTRTCLLCVAGFAKGECNLCYNHDRYCAVPRYQSFLFRAFYERDNEPNTCERISMPKTQPHFSFSKLHAFPALGEKWLKIISLSCKKSHFTIASPLQFLNMGHVPQGDIFPLQWLLSKSPTSPTSRLLHSSYFSHQHAPLVVLGSEQHDQKPSLNYSVILIHNMQDRSKWL